MVKAASALSVRLTLAGRFESESERAECRRLHGWDLVDELGVIDRTGIRRLLDTSKVGLCLLHPTPNYLEALPTKIFEYMAAGVPVIASDFPVIRRILEETGAGLCVDPTDSRAIAESIRSLLADPGRASEMARRGRKAAIERFNWSGEADKLIALYADLTGGGSGRHR